MAGGFSLYLKPFKDYCEYSQILTDTDINPPATPPNTTNTHLTDIKTDIATIQKQTQAHNKQTRTIIKQLSKQNKILNYAVAGLSIGLMLSVLF